MEENNILYKYQDDSFQDCKYKKVLPFDFKIINKDSFILLEYDGEQHYKPIYGEDRLKLQQKRDQIKNNYCKKNNIKLYRIPYTDFNNIEDKLKEILAKNKII